MCVSAPPRGTCDPPRHIGEKGALLRLFSVRELGFKWPPEEQGVLWVAAAHLGKGELREGTYGTRVCRRLRHSVGKEAMYPKLMLRYKLSQLYYFFFFPRVVICKSN